MNCKLSDLLKKADENGYAVPAFNYSDIWEMFGILDAAVEENSPVIIATNAQVADTFAIPYLANQAKYFIDSFSIPVINHLDHCWDKEKCKLAIDSGYTSVMIDGSHLLLEENIALCKEIVDYVADRNIAVEGEMGRIRGKSVEGIYDGEDYLVDVDSAERLANETGITSMAIGIGNAHGFYKGTPKINFERLEQVNSRVNTPLVLHGGTGIPVEDVRKCIKMGINKVNVGTHLHNAYLVRAREQLAACPDALNVVDIFSEVRKVVKEEAKKWIKICMSDDKA